MHINDAAMVLGSRLGAARRRQTKMAQAVITLVKKAGLTKSAWGQGLSAILKRLAPYLIGAGVTGAGMGGYALGRRGQPAADTAAGGAGYTPYAGKQPVWNQDQKKMWARMNLNPAEESSRAQAMEDFYGGLGHNMAFAKRREQLQRQGLGF